MTKPPHLYTLNMISGRVSCFCGWKETVVMNGLETIDRYKERALEVYGNHLRIP